MSTYNSDEENSYCTSCESSTDGSDDDGDDQNTADQPWIPCDDVNVHPSLETRVENEPSPETNGGCQNRITFFEGKYDPDPNDFSARSDNEIDLTGEENQVTEKETERQTPEPYVENSCSDDEDDDEEDRFHYEMKQKDRPSLIHVSSGSGNEESDSESNSSSASSANECEENDDKNDSSGDEISEDVVRRKRKRRNVLSTSSLDESERSFEEKGRKKIMKRKRQFKPNYEFCEEEGESYSLTTTPPKFAATSELEPPLTLLNYRHCLRYQLYLALKKFEKLLAYDDVRGILLYAWTSSSIYKTIDLLKFFQIVRTKMTIRGICAFELAIEQKTIYEIIEDSRIRKVRIDRPFMFPLNKELGAFDLKKYFDSGKTIKEISIALKDAHVTFCLNVDLSSDIENEINVYEHYSPLSVESAITDVYSGKGTKILLDYLSSDKKDKKSNSAFVMTVIKGVIDRWNKE